MAVLRKNILTDTNARDQYVRGVKLLKQEDSGRTTADFGIRGASRPVSTYDLFVVWHALDANHGGPGFLPWHRLMLLLLEQNLQRVLNDGAFGLPYWDWAADGDRPQAQQASAAIWGVDCMGGEGNPVSTGPFAFDPTNPDSWRVRVQESLGGGLASTQRGLTRARGVTTRALPKTAHVGNALGFAVYDSPNWGPDADGFRSRLEGWTADSGNSAPWLHNRVHVWVGGDMLRSHSPNDPVFYLNHANIDRIWEQWLLRNNRAYLPLQNQGPHLNGHRIDDPIASPLGASVTIRQMLNVSSAYTYDVLP